MQDSPDSKGSEMTENKRIFWNVIATYGRSVYALMLGLLAARWILNGLGHTDFGLYGVVGSVIAFITFLNGVMGASVTRYYAFAIGKARNMNEEDAVEEVKSWFNASLSIHTVVPLCLVTIGYPIGEYVIRHWLMIPAERIIACVWVFRVSIVTALVSMVSVPFIAFYTANQLIAELSIWGVMQTTFTFINAIAIQYYPSDKLITYAVVLMAFHVGIPICQIVRAMLMFDPCRVKLKYWYSKKCLELLSFSGWQFFGNCGSIIRAQACAVLTNVYFGPQVNAAYAVSNQVTAQTGTLSSALIGAFTPAVTSAEGQGDRQKMITMAWRVSRFGTYLVLLFMIPLSLEIEEVMRLWLNNPPPYCTSLCMVAFVDVVLGKLTVGNQIAISAQGKIAAYQCTCGTILILTLPIAWGLILWGIGPMSVVFGCLTTTIALTLGRMWFSYRLLNMSVRYWINKIVAPVLLLALISSGVGLVPRIWLTPSFTRVCLTTFCTLISSGMIGWIIVLTHEERQMLFDKFRSWRSTK